MEAKILDVLCDPKTHKPLKQNGLLLETEDGKSYPIQDNDIPIFLKPMDVVGLNRKYQHFYDKIAAWYDWVIWFYTFFYKDGMKRRLELLKDLVIKPGMKVLEPSIGTGFNITLFTKEAEYYGIDISMGMLQVCHRENRTWGYDLHIAQANAEELPFKDNSFDVVYHVGGINFFSNIPAAINEMIRVAKPGSQILISDETQEHVDKFYKRVPFVSRFFKDSKPIVVPLVFIPQTMKDIKISYSEDKRMYIITFFKP